jgi:aminoglycoside phosphotransferase (APT) family kinase protein
MRVSTAQSVIEGTVPGFRATRVVRRGGGSVNAVYEVHGAGPVRPLIVKVYPEPAFPAAERWRSKLAKEAFVYGLLARHGVEQIPRVLRVEPAGVPGLPSPFAVLSRLDGRPLSAVGAELGGADTDRVYEQMGRLLAAVHRIPAATWGYLATGIVDARPSNTAYVLDQFDRRLRRFTELGGDPALTVAVDRLVTRHAGLLGACRRPALCHNDFHEGNVLAARDGPGWRVTGYLDVENAVAADPLFDLARTDYHALQGHPARRAAFLRGYGPAAPGWAARVAVYRLHHALEHWNWTAEHGRRDRLPAISDFLRAGTSGLQEDIPA